MFNYFHESGLNCSYTYYINQQKNGIIWVATDNGLFRYDGSDFKQYGYNEGLKNVEILNVIPLKQDETFIIPFLNNFATLKKDSIISSSSNKELLKLNALKNFKVRHNQDVKNESICLYKDEWADNLYLYKNEKVIVKKIALDLGRYTFAHSIKYNFETDDFYFIANDNTNKNLLTLFAYNLNKHQLKKLNITFDPYENITEVNGNYFSTINTKISNLISVYQFTAQNTYKKIARIHCNEKVMNAIVDAKKNLWLILQNGGIQFYGNINQLNSNLPKPITFLKDYVINAVYNDFNGNIWFSSKNNGIFFLPQKSLKSYINFPNTITDHYFTAIAGTDKAIVLGDNESNSILFDGKNLIKTQLDNTSKFETKAIIINQENAYYGLNYNSVIEFNRNTKKIKQIQYGQNTLAIKNLIPFNNQMGLICSRFGLSTFDYKTNVIKKIFSENTYNALPFDKDSLLVGTYCDLYKLNDKTGEAKLFLKDCYLTDIKKIANNTYVGSSNTRGLIIFNNHKLLERITTKNGLITNQIKKISLDNKGNIWAATNQGLLYINLKNKKPFIKTLTRIDGLPSDRISGTFLRNDSIFVATSKGLGIFSTLELINQPNDLNCNVIINELTCDKKSIKKFDKELQFEHRENNIILHLSFPDYNSQGKIKYLYRVLGLHNEWIETNTSKIILNSLPSGHYTFEVYGVGYNGILSHKPTVLTFEIKTLFWEEWWFITLAAFVLLILIGLLMYFILQKRKDKKLKEILYEKKIAELELHAIKAQINPHFIYNCLNSIQYLLYRKQYKETENYLNSFANVIRMTLHYSEKTFMSISDEISYLDLYLKMEKLRFMSHFNYEIKVDSNVNKNIQIPSLLIQPFVENAIKHGINGLEKDKGCIQVLFQYHQKTLTIKIIDNGKGFSIDEHINNNKTSFGIKLSEKRIETFKQLFEVDLKYNIKSDKNKGTEVTITLQYP